MFEDLIEVLAELERHEALRKLIRLDTEQESNADE